MEEPLRHGNGSPSIRSPEADAYGWSLWRRDDHGHEFEISRGHSRAEAERLAQEFEARGHKQSYWARRTQD